MTFKTFRITLLLLILTYVGADRLLNDARVTQWKSPLRVVIYPINADASPEVEKFINTLDVSQFDDIPITLQKEARRYGLAISNPLHISLSQAIKSRPPLPPEQGSTIAIMRWSLSLRYWAWKEENYTGLTPQIRLYALYFNPQKFKRLSHSTGLKNGKIALIKLFAQQHHSPRNNVVILHELLHTLGATDKYDLSTGIPHYPDGYAEPQRKPLYPQRFAEIMGGTIPLSPTKAKMPDSLTKTRIGPKTAKEIGWLD